MRIDSLHAGPTAIHNNTDAIDRQRRCFSNVRCQNHFAARTGLERAILILRTHLAKQPQHFPVLAHRPRFDLPGNLFDLPQPQVEKLAHRLRARWLLRSLYLLQGPLTYRAMQSGVMNGNGMKVTCHANHGRILQVLADRLRVERRALTTKRSSGRNSIWIRRSIPSSRSYSSGAHETHQVSPPQFHLRRHPTAIA